MAVFSLGAAFLTVATSSSKRRTSEIEDLRAFYIAEAGLAEAFQAVRIGRTGQLGSQAAPAAFGDGVLWVDAVETSDDQVRLTSTALCGRGHSSLSLIVEPVERPLGFFADEDLVLESVLLVDGFNSDEGSYHEQVDDGWITIDPSNPQLHIDEFNGILFYEGTFYRYQSRDGDTYCFDQQASVAELAEIFGHLSEYDLQEDDFLDGDDDFEDVEYKAVVAYFLRQREVSLPSSWGITGEAVVIDADPVVEGAPEVPSSDDDAASHGPTYTTAGGGLLGSNGNVQFALPEGEQGAVIYGDVVPGPDGMVAGLGDVQITGSTDPRVVPVELPPVEVPQATMEPATYHDGLLPMVVPPRTSGHESIRVAADAELILRGPATVVIGELILDPGATMTLDTRNGDVELFITGEMDLQEGSVVTTSSEAADELSIQVAAIESGADGAPIKLEATSTFCGTIYAPETEVRIGTNFEIFGAVVARKLEIGPGARLHFDNADFEDSPIPGLVSWRIVELPAAVRTRRGSPAELLGIDPGAVPALADAHDLGSVALTIEYHNHSGATLTYTGSEGLFDWGVVADVVTIERNSTRPKEDPGAGEPPLTGDPGPPAEIRTHVQDMIDRRIAGGMPNGGEVFVDKLVADYLPLSAAEWSAIYAIPKQPNDFQMTRLKEADLAAGGQGGTKP